MSTDYEILLMFAQQEDAGAIEVSLMEYFKQFEAGKQEYVSFQPIATCGFYCDYVKNLNQSDFVEYVKNIKWRNDDHVFLAISSNADPFEICIASPWAHKKTTTMDDGRYEREKLNGICQCRRPFMVRFKTHTGTICGSCGKTTNA